MVENVDRKTFDKFRNIVYEKSGISLGEGKEALVMARVSKRMRVLGISGFTEYLKYVMQDETEDEIVNLLDVISTNVTSFFREPDHFEFLHNVVSEWSASGHKRFRFWSAASSSGEEPYSMAITLMETLRESKSDVKILATDISTRVLEKCKSGVYEKSKLAGVSPLILDRYFESSREGGKTFYRAKDLLKDLITFTRINLSAPSFPMQGPLDVVFCRNVMIYFDKATRAKLVAEIHRLLKKGGYLIVGHSESLMGIETDFKVIKPSIYKK